MCCTANSFHYNTNFQRSTPAIDFNNADRNIIQNMHASTCSSHKTLLANSPHRRSKRESSPSSKRATWLNGAAARVQLYCAEAAANECAALTLLLLLPELEAESNFHIPASDKVEERRPQMRSECRNVHRVTLFSTQISACVAPLNLNAKANRK